MAPAGSGSKILVVANKMEATTALHRRRARARRRRRRRASSSLSRIPTTSPFDRNSPDTGDGEQVLERALPLLRRRPGPRSKVGSPIAPTPTTTSSKSSDGGEYREIILETPPSHVSHWLHVDLPQRIAQLGYPLTTVAATSVKSGECCLKLLGLPKSIVALEAGSLSFAQTAALGALAGFTIYLGLPFGRLTLLGDRARVALAMFAVGVLAFIFVDVMEHAFGIVEAAVEGFKDDRGSFGHAVGLAALLGGGFALGLAGLAMIERRLPISAAAAADRRRRRRRAERRAIASSRGGARLGRGRCAPG